MNRCATGRPTHSAGRRAGFTLIEMVVVLAMGIGLFAPPFGVGFYAACAVGRVNPDLAMNRVWPYLGALMVALIIVAAVPWLSIGFL